MSKLEASVSRSPFHPSDCVKKHISGDWEVVETITIIAMRRTARRGAQKVNYGVLLLEIFNANGNTSRDKRRSESRRELPWELEGYGVRVLV